MNKINLKDLKYIPKKEWVLYLLSVIVFAIICVLLSIWQFNRLDEAKEKIATLETNWNATEDYDIINTFNASDEYKQLTLSGNFLEDVFLYIRNRPLNGKAGYEILQGFKTDAGNIVFVDRGWVAQESDASMPTINPLNKAHTSITIRLKPGFDGESEIADNSIFSFYIEYIANYFANAGYFDISNAKTAFYGQLIDIENSALEENNSVLTEIPKPNLTEGSHLSYGLQWICFGILAFIGYAYALNATIKKLKKTKGNISLMQSNARLTKSRQDKDTDYEDKLLD